ncbi:MAG: hypothetical protein RR816_05810, partial [Clostridia bacterium]
QAIAAAAVDAAANATVKDHVDNACNSHCSRQKPRAFLVKRKEKTHNQAECCTIARDCIGCDASVLSVVFIDKARPVCYDFVVEGLDFESD